MEKPDFSLPFSSSNTTSTTRYWLWLAVATLAISGLGPLILLAGRASRFAEKSFIKSSFAEALVVHVNLSAVAWFLAIALLMWSLFTQPRHPRIYGLREAAIVSFAMGMLCVAGAPLMGNGTALFSNYIPMYTSPLFLVGLGLMAIALLCGILDIRLSRNGSIALSNAQSAQHFGILGSAFIVLVALAHFGWAYIRLPMPDASLSPGAAQNYYEIIFWAGGHILQLAYTQLLLVAWLWLGSAAGLNISINKRLLLGLFSIYPLIALTSPLGFVGNSAPYNLEFYTQQMRHGGGSAAILLGLYLAWRLIKSGKPDCEQRLPWICLVTSMAVFLVGGVIGYMISGTNTIIPAHYHGSIVGTTVAFMGVIYLLLPRLGYASPLRSNAAIIQPLLYGGGSVLHAVGFAIAGGYGAERKAVGAADSAPEAMHSALQVMRVGGGLAVIGGAMFVVLVIIAIRRKSKSTDTSHTGSV
ncbi:MAG: cbb3-type cytochrome c oxidase subunit I [Alphaproteobacteria bacterium]|nr:cbb3-type cytochrome c oxidase subunit I [Alphaproteobacteria bacterium]